MPTQAEIALLKDLAAELEQRGITLIQALLPEVGWRLEVVRQGVGQIAAVEYHQIEQAKAALLLLLNDVSSAADAEDGALATVIGAAERR
jgi:hypothetical protein